MTDANRNDDEQQSDREQPIELPDLQDGVLDPRQLTAYLNELIASDVPVHLVIKSTLQDRARKEETLATLGHRLQTGEVRSAQLRYPFEGAVWVDTVMAIAHGFRIVRMCSS